MVSTIPEKTHHRANVANGQKLCVDVNVVQSAEACVANPGGFTLAEFRETGKCRFEVSSCLRLLQVVGKCTLHLVGLNSITEVKIANYEYQSSIVWYGVLPHGAHNAPFLVKSPDGWNMDVEYLDDCGVVPKYTGRKSPRYQLAGHNPKKLP